MSRFDGKQWRPVPHLAKLSPASTLVAGGNGTILAECRDGWAIFTKDTLFQSATLEALVAAHAAEFAAGFRGPHRAHWYGDNVFIQADKEGNIWMVRFRTRQLSVFSRGQWLDPTEAMIRAGAQQNRVSVLAGVGDGAKVYVNDAADAKRGGCGLLGRVESGALIFEIAPHSSDLHQTTHPLYDADGALWVLGESKDKERRNGISTFCLTAKGIGDEIKDLLPYLVDPSGNVWGRPGPYPMAKDPLKVWRGGHVSEGPALHGLDRYARLLSDRPGSVYVWTDLGVQHLVASAADPAQFKVDRVYSLAIEGRPWQIDYTPLGFFVISSFVPRQPICNLDLVPLPTALSKP
jgi:hypothetical protein